MKTIFEKNLMDEKQEYLLQNSGNDDTISLGEFTDEQEALQKADEVMPNWRIKRYRMTVAEPKILTK